MNKKLSPIEIMIDQATGYKPKGGHQSPESILLELADAAKEWHETEGEVRAEMNLRHAVEKWVSVGG